MRPRLRVLIPALVGVAVFATIGAAITPGDQASLHATMDKFVATSNWYDRCVEPTSGAVTCVAPTTTSSTTTTTTTAPPATTTTTKPPTTTTTVPAGAPMPTRANTGPSGITGTMTAAQFLSSGVCDHKRIVEQVRDEVAAMQGRTFTLNNCALDGGLYYANYGLYPDSAFPVVTMRSSSITDWLMFSPMRVTADKMFVQGAFWVPCPECGAQDHAANQTQRAMPVAVTNSYFWVPQPPPPPYPYHSEALHVVGAGIGYSFTNVRFTQEGPPNNNITAALKFTGRDSTFRNVYLDWGGTQAAAYYAGYWEGTNVVIDGCRIEQGYASPGYKFPDVGSPGNGYVVPPLTNCRDWNTGAPIA